MCSWTIVVMQKPVGVVGVMGVRCLLHHCFGSQSSSTSQELCFIMNEWRGVFLHSSFNWHRSKELWCMRRGGGETESSLLLSFKLCHRLHASLAWSNADCRESSSGKWGEQQRQSVGREEGWGRHQMKCLFTFPWWGNPESCSTCRISMF